MHVPARAQPTAASIHLLALQLEQRLSWGQPHGESTPKAARSGIAWDPSFCHMVLTFRGSQHFRQRLVCSTLSGKAICIRDIRAKYQDPGVRDYEASLLRLLEKITNGCVVEINETGV